MPLHTLLDMPAPAKLNLFLHVVGRRDDGYHLLQSAFMLIDWCDVLHFERRADGVLNRTDLGPALPDDDLCLRAARALQQASGTTLGANIAIDKQVPWGAGLGGGSSDAATTLLALNRLWGLNWPRQRLLPLALRLGADVPFFVQGRSAWVEGIGERMTPITLPDITAAVIKPPIAVPTPAIFGSPLLSRNTPTARIADFLADPIGFGRNDLQPVAVAFEKGSSSHLAAGSNDEDEPLGGIESALDQLAQAFGSSRMTGSGSAVFAVAGSGMYEPSDTLARLLATAPQGWSGRMCRSLEAHPLVAWAAD
ncbi:MAG: 4-(cytidine 5'-diphospho)-2-C-methyl-D-erythritol kinase [Burkholderiales bacterium]